MSKNNSLLNPIVLISLFGILAGLVLIYMARNQSSDGDENAESLGYVDQATDDVRLKRLGNMHWYVAEEDQRLYHGDLIFSGEKARTILKLKDHGELTLGPYSMVIIQSGFIQVESGEVELKADKATTIKTFGEVLKVSSKSSTTIIDTPTVKTITLSDKDKLKPDNVKTQETIKKAIEKKVLVAEVVKKPEIVDLQIQGLLRVWEPEKQAMRLTFNSTLKFDRVELTVKNASFEQMYENQEAIELKDLPAGTYQINAYGYLAGAVVSKSAEQSVEVVIPIKKLKAPKIRDSNIKYSM